MWYDYPLATVFGCRCRLPGSTAGRDREKPVANSDRRSPRKADGPGAGAIQQADPEKQKARCRPGLAESGAEERT